MRARHRHFNPRFAGAEFVIDSRFINSANNNKISAWSDRSGNNNNLVQGTTARQPTFVEAQQGGQPVVRFLTGGMTSQAGITTPITQLSVISTLKSFNYNGTVGVGGGAIFSQGTSFLNDILIARTNTEHFFQFNNGTDGSASINSPGSSNQIQAHIFNGSEVGNSNRAKYFYNNVEQNMSFGMNFPNSVTPSGVFSIGAYSVDLSLTPWFLDGEICSVCVLRSALNKSLQNKLIHSAAYSFKIACS